MSTTVRRAKPGVSRPPRVNLQARKQEFARAAIWTVAVDLFAEKGFEETTIDDIVVAAGTSRRTFFRHFESKRDLMAQPVVSYVALLQEAIEACPRRCSPAELFHAVVRGVAPRTVAEPRMRKVMEISARYPAAREAQLSRVAELQDEVAGSFLDRTDSEVTAHLLASLTLSTLGLVYRVWFREGQRDIQGAVQLVLAELADTVKAPKG
ncbi:MAG: TetR family transcriptional regulator [Paludibaculum sp.]